ncbi:hypothetical protein Acr_00g0089670 [Actinidia rufa]|uniref:Uncharacterized protein n=1 Tax=Actinidia rufa TaxID=165716 RepID=A0A7J0DXB9_9ERIC|nr:hypothetical protein Acr_00g0089670 [Actinidia rufa]
MPKKSRKEDVFGASTGKIMEAMNYGNRKKSMKAKKRVVRLAPNLPDRLTLIIHLVLSIMQLVLDLCPWNADTCKEAAKLYNSCGQIEHSINILKDYLKHHPSERVQVIKFFYRAINSLEDSVDARLTLVSLVVEEKKADEAISLLSSNNINMTLDSSSETKSWWHNEKVKLKLANIYQAKGMLEEYVDVIFPLIQESLIIENTNIAVRARKNLLKSVLLERARVLDDYQTDLVFCGFRPTANASELLKAARAKKLLQKKSNLKGEMKAKALAAGLNWHSGDSDDEPPRQEFKKPLLPQLLEDAEYIISLLWIYARP